MLPCVFLFGLYSWNKTIVLLPKEIYYSMMAFMGYYGQTQNMANLSPDNIFVSYFLAALVEIPCWAVPFVISRLGCRWPLLAFFLVSGFCGVVYGALPADNGTLQLSVGLMGKMTVTGAYYICQQYSSEVFPTVVRGQGVSQISTFLFFYLFVQLALCEVAGGVAIFLSPMVVYLTKFSPILPLLILGLCSLLGALATFFLPETAGRELPHTLRC